MVLTEYDCSQSSAVLRIALNKGKNELIVQFRDSSQVYLYSGVPSDTAARLASDASKGELVSDIKKKCHVRKISQFPLNVRMHIRKETSNVINSKAENSDNKKHSVGANSTATNKMARAKKKNKFNNYSNLWLDVLANKTVRNRKYLEGLLPLLEKLHPQFPPAEKPPLTTEIDSQSSAALVEEDDYEALSNVFSELYVDVSSDDDSDTESTTKPDAKTGGVPDKQIQSRYLIVRVICSIAENFREEAVSAQRDKDYSNVKLKWTLAWETLMTCQENIDEWCALLYAHSDENATDPFAISASSPALPKKHSRPQLVELFLALQLLIQDTERQKDNALAQLQRRIQFICGKLNPMLQDRNEVKVSMGEEKWTNNPEPKQTYAEKRRLWEEECRVLCDVTAHVESLNFNAVYDSR